MPGLNRRDFLKALGISGGASALSACGLDNNIYKTPIESILPYVVKPEQVTNGTYTFFATSVLRGPHAQPVTARHRDGRVTFVSANFQAPTKPAVDKAALLELQKHYSPDRLQGPTNAGAAVSWDDGLSTLTDAVKTARGQGKKVVFLGGYKSGAITSLLDAYTDGNAIYWEPAGYEAEALAAEALFGSRALPYYDFTQADYVLSFGAPFLSGWGDADTAARFADAKNPNIGHSVARFALVSPMRDATGANADDFFAVTPGSELIVARAIAGLVAKQNGAPAAITALIGSVSVADAAAASGLDAARIEAVAGQFAAGKGLALPGGFDGSTDLAAATYLLNLAAGAGGTRFHLGGYAGPIHAMADIQQLKADLDAGNVGVLIIDDANPVYALPADLGIAASIAKAGLVVSTSSHPDETAALASLVLPTSDAFEDWGDEEPVAGFKLLRQPAMSPLHDTRSLGDVLLTTGRAAGIAAAAATPAEPVEGEEPVVEAMPMAPKGPGFEATTWQDYLAETWRAFAYSGAGSFEAFWEASVIAGFVDQRGTPVAPTVTASGYTFETPAGQGSGGMHLVLHTHPHLIDGRYANQPWAQETAEPITGVVWGSWLRMNDATASKLGVSTNDEVEVSTPGGAIKVGVFILPGIKDDVVSLALGNGHTASGRYANGYGVNAFSAVSAATDGKGAQATGPLKVDVKATGAQGDVVTTFSTFGRSDEGRHFGVHVDATKLANAGDAPAAHPGELTGIHHLELDKRLTERGITDFYGLPDHPTYRFGMNVDTNACTGCQACHIACAAENNLPVVGKRKVKEGREMVWIRINRYWEDDVGGTDDVRFVPLMCQHCGHAGCENVCPVLATYHNIDGLNAMVYNRCVGTRYCSNACPFSARRFNYHTYAWPEPFNLMLNPDVSTRVMGVMEKCTFCIQRIRQTKSAYKDGGNYTRNVPTDAWAQVPACAEACPSQAITFGNLNDAESDFVKTTKSGRAYQPLADLNVFGAVTYLAKANFHDDPTAHHGGGHGGGHAAGHDDDHGEAKAGHDGDHAEAADHGTPKGAEAGHDDDHGENH